MKSLFLRSDQLWMAEIVSSRLIPGLLCLMKSTEANTSSARVDSNPEISLMVSLRLSALVLNHAVHKS